MAAISSISNGEAMSSVRTKLNDVITNVNLLDPTDWVDYSSTSTIVGWSSFTTKQIRYRIIGKQLFVHFFIVGTSNSTSTNFTIPNNSINNNEIVCAVRAIDNGTTLTNFAMGRVLINSNTVNFFQNTQGADFTNTGTKRVSGQFFIEIA